MKMTKIVRTTADIFFPFCLVFGLYVVIHGHLTPGGGFQGPGGTVSTDTVAKALVAPNKTPVVLTGHVVERVAGKDDKYLFQDESGKIMVEIDHKDPGGEVRIRYASLDQLDALARRLKD